MKKPIRISEEHKDITCDNCGWSWDIEPDDKHPYLCHQCGHKNFKHQYNEQNDNKEYLLQMRRKSIIVEQYGDEAELFKLASAYYRKNGKVMTIKVLEKVLHFLSKRDEPHRAKSKEFPPSLYLQEQVVQGDVGDPYEYKKEGGYYYARKKGAKDWILTRGNMSSAVAKKFTSPNVNISSPKPYTMDDSVRYQRDSNEPYAQQNLKQIKLAQLKSQSISKSITGDYLMIIAFPQYEPKVDKGETISWVEKTAIKTQTGEIPREGTYGKIGHAGIALVSKSGDVKLFEFGRYNTKKGQGRVISKNLGKIAKIDKSGKFLNANEVATIVKANTQGEGPRLEMVTAVVPVPNLQKSLQFAEGPAIREYEAVDFSQGGAANCGTFAIDTAKAGGVNIGDFCSPMPIKMIANFRNLSTEYFNV
jgi:hypothetical protein